MQDDKLFLASPVRAGGLPGLCIEKCQYDESQQDQEPNE